MEGPWNPIEGSRRVHFAGITGLQSRECQQQPTDIALWYRTCSQRDRDCYFLTVPACDDLSDAMGNAGDQGVAHAECAMPVRHTVRRPAFRKHLQLVQLVGHEPPVPSIL